MARELISKKNISCDDRKLLNLGGTKLIRQRDIFRRVNSLNMKFQHMLMYMIAIPLLLLSPPTQQMPFKLIHIIIIIFRYELLNYIEKEGILFVVRAERGNKREKKVN
jgi:hypothetical protein